MSRLESADRIEARVGAKRHTVDHLARAVSAEQRVYLLHSAECVSRGIDLRECEFSIALDMGINRAEWVGFEDEPVRVIVDPEFGDLLPAPLEVSTEAEARR